MLNLVPSVLLPAPSSFQSYSGRPLQPLGTYCLSLQVTVQLLVEGHFVGESCKGIWLETYAPPTARVRLRVNGGYALPIDSFLEKRSDPVHRVSPLLLLASFCSLLLPFLGCQWVWTSSTLGPTPSRHPRSTLAFSPTCSVVRSVSPSKWTRSASGPYYPALSLIGSGGRAIQPGLRFVPRSRPRADHLEPKWPR